MASVASSPEPAPLIRTQAELLRRMYTIEAPANSCVRLLNATAEIGCAGEVLGPPQKLRCDLALAAGRWTQFPQQPDANQVILIVVIFVSIRVHVYSVSSVCGDPHSPCLMCYLSIFYCVYVYVAKSRYVYTNDFSSVL